MQPHRFGAVVVLLTWWSVSTVAQTASYGRLTLSPGPS
jgi:hypothetical protein